MSLQAPQNESKRLFETLSYLNKASYGDYSDYKGNRDNKEDNTYRQDKKNRKLNIASLHNRMLIQEPAKAYELISKDCDDLSSHFHNLVRKTFHTAKDRNLLVGASSVVAEHLQEASDLGGAKRGRQSERELLAESERILAKTLQGLSLHERLKRDPELLAEKLDLLNYFKNGVMSIL